MSRRWLPPGLWAAFMLVLTSIPGDLLPDVSGAPAGTDKVVHATMYAILGWLLARAIPSPNHPLRTFVLLLLGIAVFAALDEWHQAFIPGRYASVVDWVADVAGALVGLAVGALRWRREQLA